ncbi:MAG: NADH-quinone oxidoreductase subunit NuoH [Acidimicrobiales bacterium]
MGIVMFGLGDPLFADGVDLTVVLIVALKVVVVFVFLLVATMFMVWFERKLVGDMQNRLGPNRAGPFGILQTVADGLKLFAKEDLLPTRADKWVFRLAPYMSVVPAFVVFAVVPMGGVFADGKQGTFRIAGHDTFWQVADPPVGVLLVLAMSSVAVYGVILAGWSSGSKYPLLGAVRGSAQMVSYEAALGLSTVAVVLVTQSLSTHDMVVEQATPGNELLGFIPLPNWNIIQAGVVPFIVFLLAATAELKRPPFDLVEAEQELVGGFHTEYSSIRFALFFVAEFMGTVTMAGIIVTLFLGGPSGPLLVGPDWIWPILWFFAKVFVFLFIFVWFRATLPRFRYDQLMDLGWKLLIPLSLGWLLLIAAIRIGDDEGWSPALVTLISGAVIIVAGVLLSLAMRTSARRREAEEVHA